MMPPDPQMLLQPLQLAMLQLQQLVVMRRAQVLVCLLPALLMPPEWDAAICAQFAIARTGVPPQGCINNTPATITAGIDWDIINPDSAEVSLEVLPSGFDFNAGQEPDIIQSCAVESGVTDFCMALPRELDDRYDRMVEFQIFRLPGSCGITVNFLVSWFFHTCLSVTSEPFAALSFASVQISWTSWKSWTGLDVTSGSMDEVSFERFSGMLSIQDADAMSSQPVSDVLEVNPEIGDGSLFGPGLVDALECDTVRSSVAGVVVPDVQQLDKRADVPFSRADVNKALFEARLQNFGDTELKYPWEHGAMVDIFAETDSCSGVPGLPVECLGFTEQLHDATGSAAASVSARRSSGRDLVLPFYSFAIRDKTDKDLFAEQEVLRTRALDKWSQIFEVLGFPGELGDALDAELRFGDPSEQGTGLRDALGIKSPRTALKRAQTLLQCFKWLQCNCVDWNPWDRSRCLTYLSSSEGHVPAASLGMLFLEALRFSRHVLQISIPDNLIQDSQLKGRAQRLQLTRDGYHPARSLKAKDGAALERLMMDSLDILDEYMIGAILLAISSWSRWSDLQFIHRVWVDRSVFEGLVFGFIETETAFRKTAISFRKKMRFLPIVCPILEVTGIGRTTSWLETFSLLHVVLSACPFGPICRAPGTDGLLRNRSCTSNEISVFINKVLKTADDDRLTSHSFKHTTLSWVSAYGIDEPARTLPGYHELQGANALAVNSRDMLNRPLQVYCSLLTNTRGDHFRPDESRTSRMLDLMKSRKAGHDGLPAVPEVVCTPAPSRPSLETEDEAVPATPLDESAFMNQISSLGVRVRAMETVTHWHPPVPVHQMRVTT